MATNQGYEKHPDTHTQTEVCMPAMGSMIQNYFLCC